MKRKGIGFIEVIVAIFLSAFMLVGMLQMIITGMIQVKAARHRAVAIETGAGLIEVLKYEGYEAINPADYPKTYSFVVDKGRLESSSDDQMGTATVNVVSITDARKVTVTVSWNEPGKSLSEILETLLYKLT